MKPIHPHARRRLARGAMTVVMVMLGVLGVAFFRIQVLSSDSYALQSESNRLRVVPEEAPRGTIYDRHGVPIADNVPAYSVSLFPAPPDSIRATLERLAPHLDLDEEAISRLVDRARTNPRLPLVVTHDAELEQVAALEERRPDFPEVFLEKRPKRRYHGARSVGHVMGHVGEVSREELASPFFEDYEQGMIVGKEGVERQYEGILQGRRGVRYLEVDAAGRVVGSFRGQSATPAEPGADIQLNVDLELTKYIDEIFPDTLNGAVVALDPDDGGVLALYSHPTADPNAFVGGIDFGLWTELTTDPDRPLVNRAVSGLYSPASTWKLATAAIALEHDLIDPDEVMPEACTGAFRYGNVVRRCWDADGHGSVDLADAIRHSCNVYFYQVGLRIGLERLVEEGSRLGFDGACGVDLPRESPGNFPDGLEWWERRWGYRPYENEVLTLAIGQGPNDQTPLKMAQFYVALAGDGTAPAPRLRRDDDGDRGEDWSLDLSEENLEALRDGLRAVMEQGGTGFLSSLEHWDIMGKTGTSQHDPFGQREPHAWFAGMAGPWDEDPEIVIVVLVEEGGSGSEAAAPVAAKAADFYLRRKHDIPMDTIQTLRDHLEAGVPAPWAWDE